MSGMIQDEYKIEYKGEYAGTYYIYDDNEACLDLYFGREDEMKADFEALGFKKNEYRQKKPHGFFFDMMTEENRDKSRIRPVYHSGDFKLERIPWRTQDRFFVYRRDAKQGEEGYSPLAHDAPHKEGPNTPEDMREWANWYSFEKFDDNTYQASLDEAWWWGGGHNDGGTVHRDIPEEWFKLSYDGFLERVVTLSSAAHYGFTPEILKEKEGLKEFFGF
ncbi:MAG: hypothetical protein IJ740_14955 [Ruminococcus sp.]|nr:hypothetical protein [Ruminococcus sp.]